MSEGSSESLGITIGEKEAANKCFEQDDSDRHAARQHMSYVSFLRKLDSLSPGRMERACASLGINYVSLFKGAGSEPYVSSSLSIATIRRLHVFMSEVFVDDLLKASGQTPLEQVDLRGLDSLHGSLIALDTAERLQRIPNYDRARSCGKGFRGLCERVHVILTHRERVVGTSRLSPLDDTAQLICDSEFLSSRFVEREPAIGLVVRLYSGMWFVKKVIYGGGAYIVLLFDVQGLQNPIIVCRGTAMKLKATHGLRSFVSDLNMTIGMSCVYATWPILRKFLAENNVKAARIVGKSLGGGYAQHLSVLICGLMGPEAVESLVTVASVGCGDETLRVFQSDIMKGSYQDPPFPIIVIRKGGLLSKRTVDLIPLVGGNHLGCDLDRPNRDVSSASWQLPTTGHRARVLYIEPMFEVAGGDDETGAPYNIEGVPAVIDFFSTLADFFHSFSSGHCCQTTLYGDFRYREVGSGSPFEMEARMAVQAELRRSGVLEPKRRTIATMVNIGTLGLLEGNVSFHEYYMAETTHVAEVDLAD